MSSSETSPVDANGYGIGADSPPFYSYPFVRILIRHDFFCGISPQKKTLMNGLRIRPWPSERGKSTPFQAAKRKPERR